MTRLLFVLTLCCTPLGAAAQTLTLASLFEDACLAPFDLFFGQTEDVLRGHGFEVQASGMTTEFTHEDTGMTESYSANPENPFCTIHDPRATPEEASRTAQTLLAASYDETPQPVPANDGQTAWGISRGGCCYLTVQIDDRNPMDVREGASMRLLVQDR